MEFMDIFNIIVGVCSILSCVISLFIANTVYKINKSNKQTAKAKNDSTTYQAGGNIEIKK